MFAGALIGVNVPTMARAAGDQSISIGWDDSSSHYFSTDSPFSLDITLLADNRADTGHQILWNGGAMGIWTGSGPDVFIDLTNATDVNSTHGSSPCLKVAPTVIGNTSVFRGQCFSNFNGIVGHTYNLALENDASLGPNWFHAVVTDKSGSDKFVTGSVKLLDATTIFPVTQLRARTVESSASSDCNNQPIQDVIYSNLQFNDVKVGEPNPQNTTVSDCINAIAVSNVGGPPGYVVKIGGVNPASRNLEGSINQPASNPSTPSSASSRVTSLPTELSACDSQVPITKNLANTPPAQVLAEARTEIFTTLDLLVDHVPLGTCMGVDIWVDGAPTAEIIAVGSVNQVNNASEVASKGWTTNFRLPIDTHLLGCKPFDVYPWYVYGNIRSPYGQVWKSSGCAGAPLTNQSLGSHTTFEPISTFPNGVAEVQQRMATLISSRSKPSTPQIQSLSYSNGNLQILVNLPNLVKDGITSAQLISPVLGYPSTSPLIALIAAGKAIFTCPISQAISGKTIPVSITSSSQTSQSEPLISSITIPNFSVAPSKVSATPSLPAPKKTPSKNLDQKFVPSTPSNPAYKLSANQVVISVDAPSKPGAVAVGAMLLAPDLGFTQAHPVIGSLSGGKAIFRIVLSPSMAGKSAQVAIYLTNAAGSSAPLAGQVTLPPVIPGGAPDSNPSHQGAGSIKCSKGSITRTFSGYTCPPGWGRS